MEPAELLDPIRRLHARIRDAVLSECERRSLEELSGISRDGAGDTIFEIDRVSEEVLVAFLEEEIARRVPIILVAEGIPDGRIVLPRGTPERDARLRLIVDPIDGTRGLMYQKRSAWVLTGVARERGGETGLADVELAVQTEIPLVQQHLSESYWALRGRGAQGERLDRLRGESKPLHPRPSKVPTIAQGYASVSRFFPGARDELAAIDEEVVRGALGPAPRGKTHCFEDQYASTGGQLRELFTGRDRWIADLRPLMARTLAARGQPLGICCHPYDIATELIAREAGVVITDERGRPLHSPLDVEAEVAWVGYANESIRAEVEPQLQAALRRRGLIP